MINWRQLLLQSNIDMVFRVDEPLLWDSTFISLYFRPVAYLNSTLDYQLAYQRGHGGDWQEASCVLRLNNKPIAIWPLTVSCCNGIASLSSQGRPVMPPIFVSECSARIRKKIAAECLHIASKLAVQLDVEEWYSVLPFSDRAGLDDWQITAMRKGARCSVRHDLYIDLHLTWAQIKSGFRKSYRSLVTSGEGLWQVEILGAPGDTVIWDEFRLLHAEVAGRITRSQESWQLQHEALATDEGFLVALRDADGRMVGGGFFSCTADEGVYGVGAYDRSLFDKPLGHIVQYHAIRELQRRGCRWYYLGARCFPGDIPAPSEKELSIAAFKQGFASHVFPTFILAHPVGSMHR